MSRVIKYDAVNLAETLTVDLVKVIYRYMAPGMPPAKFKFEIDVPNAKEFAEAAQLYYEMGGDIDSDELRNNLGLAKPKPGAPVLSKLQSMQPAAMGMEAQGVPQAQPAGPGGAGPQQPPPAGGGPSMPQGAGDQVPALLKREGSPERLARHDVQQELRDVVAHYRIKHGLGHAALSDVAGINPVTGKRYADIYHALKSDPTNPDVQRAYREFVRHTEQQAQALKDAGFSWEFTDDDPYKSSADMLRDLYDTKHIRVYRTQGDQ
jgi:hypothetical protein